MRQWTFISAEAVAWIIKSVDGVDEKQDAVELGQVKPPISNFDLYS